MVQDLEFGKIERVVLPDYLILRGSMGVGKSTTCAALYQYLEKMNIPRAFVQSDYIRRITSDRAPTPRNKTFAMENIVDVANNCISAGYFTIIEGVFYEDDFVKRLKSDVRGDYRFIRLTCEREQCYLRDASRQRFHHAGKQAIDFVFDSFEDYEDEVIIDNSFLSVEETLEKIVCEITLEKG